MSYIRNSEINSYLSSIVPTRDKAHRDEFAHINCGKKLHSVLSVWRFANRNPRTILEGTYKQYLSQEWNPKMNFILSSFCWFGGLNSEHQSFLANIAIKFTKGMYNIWNGKI